VEAGSMRGNKIKMACAQVNRFLYSGSSIIEEKQKSLITQGEWTTGMQTREKGVYLIVFQIESLWRRRTLDRDGGHLLRLG
jgi:hypothetical protein